MSRRSQCLEDLESIADEVFLDRGREVETATAKVVFMRSDAVFLQNRTLAFLIKTL